MQQVQPTQSSQSTNKLNIVNPLNPNEIIKTEDLIEKPKQENDTNQKTEINEVTDNNQYESKPKKKSNKLIILLLLLIVIIGIAAVVYFTFFNNPKTETEPVPTPAPNESTEESEVTLITLNDILNNFNNNSTIKQLQETNEITANIENNKLIISVKAENQEPTLYEYTLENRNLKTTFKTTDLTANIIFLVIADNIGQFHGTEENETYNFLSSIDFTAAQVDGISYTLNNDNVELSINIDKKIDTSSLKTMYIETNDLKKHESFIKDSGSIQFIKGNLLFYKQGDDKTTTIIIAEKDNLSNLTYNSILSVVEFLYPNELEQFKTSYPELTTISFNRYTITENPELTGEFIKYFEQYQNDYKFIEIKINKGA